MKHIYKIVLITLIFLSMTTPSFAEKDMPINVNSNEAVIVVQGIVCSFCAQGIQKKLSKLSFINSAKYTKGIKVDIEEQKVIIALDPKKKADFKEVFSMIRAGGYEPVKAYINENGTDTVTYSEKEK